MKKLLFILLVLFIILNNINSKNIIWNGISYDDSIEEVKNNIENKYMGNNPDCKIYEDIWDAKEANFMIDADFIDNDKNNFKKLESFIFDKNDHITNIICYFYKNKLVSLYIYGDKEITDEIFRIENILYKEKGNPINMGSSVDRNKVTNYLKLKNNEVDERVINEYMTKLKRNFYLYNMDNQFVCILQFYPDYLLGSNKQSTLCLFISKEFSEIIKWQFLEYLQYKKE
jgi:hypothetical protein